MKRFNISLMGMFLLGCSGGTFESGDETANVATSNGSGEATSTSSSTSATSTNSTSTGSGGAASSSSSNSTGSGGACEPKTCLDIDVKSCGNPDNGCGHKLDCGNCTGDYQECGGSPPNSDGSNGVGVDNVCGGGCTDIGVGCPNDPMFVVDLFDCNVKGLVPPKANCESVGMLPTAAWCCKVSAK